MEPLDLRTRPPRSPKAPLDGLLFLARSIDKVRASLPGGDLGDYKIPGFTSSMFDMLGVTTQEFTDVVASAPSDAAVAAWLRAKVEPGKYAKWNATVEQRPLVGTGDREEAIRRYPWMVERPDIERQIDLLEEDDRRAFSLPKS